MVLRPNSTVFSEYLKYSLLNEIIINLINSSTYGSKMPRADWDFISKIEIPFPRLDEQKMIVKYIEERIKKIDIVISKAEQEVKLAKEYMESLIFNVVTGQIKVD